jgi:predicted aconitase with swiveling domain
MKLEVLVAASPARTLTGRALHLLEPISFWGGVSPADGTLVDARCAHHGESITGRVLFIRELKGSSSGSSVLLELIYRGIAPSAIVVSEPDAILTLGVLVANEMQWPAPAIFRLPVAEQTTIPPDVALSIDPDGRLSSGSGAT